MSECIHFDVILPETITVNKCLPEKVSTPLHNFMPLPCQTGKGFAFLGPHRAQFCANRGQFSGNFSRGELVHLTMMMRRFFQLLTLSILTLALTGCGAWRSTERGMTNFFYSPAVEAEMGNQYAEQIQGEYNLIEDPVAQAWVDRVGAALVEHSPDCPQDFNFYLTDSKDVNAFAIPGGHCYVNVGLMLYADNEAQVAAVVGHEINHVTARHGMMHLQRAAGLELVIVGASAAISDEKARAAAIVAGQAGGYLALQSFGREDEREADKLGIDAMYNAGWDPREGRKFFEKLHALSGGNDPGKFAQLLSTHPATAERIANIDAQIAEYDLWSIPLITDTPEFQALKARLQAIYGESDPTAGE